MSWRMEEEEDFPERQRRRMKNADAEDYSDDDDERSSVPSVSLRGTSIVLTADFWHRQRYHGFLYIDDDEAAADISLAAVAAEWKEAEAAAKAEKQRRIKEFVKREREQKRLKEKEEKARRLALKKQEFKRLVSAMKTSVSTLGACDDSIEAATAKALAIEQAVSSQAPSVSLRGGVTTTSISLRGTSIGIAERVKKLYSAGATIRTIAQILNSEGYKSPQGRRMSTGTVYLLATKKP